MSGDQIWYVAINDEQVGPLSEEEVRAEIAAGNVTADTFIWRDGMDDWVSVYDSGVFNDVIAAEFADAAGDSADAFFAGLAGASASASSDAAFAAAAAAATAAPKDNLFASVSSTPSSAAVAGMRNENSVLFSLDELASTTRKASDAPSVTEGSGLIDLSALAAAPPPSAAREESSSSTAAPISVTPVSGGPSVVALAPPKKSSAGTAMFAIAGVVILGLVGAILFATGVVGGKEEEPALTAEQIQAQIEAAAAAAAEKTREELAAQEAERAKEREAQEAAAAAAAKEAEAAAAAAAAAAREERDERAGRPRSTSSSSSSAGTTAPSAATSGSTAPRSSSSTSGSTSTRSGSTSSGGGDSVSAALAAISGSSSGSSSSAASAPAPAADSGGGALSDTQIRTTIRRYQTQVQRCATSPESAGQYRVAFTINPNGSTSGARAQGGGAVGDCVAGVVSSMRFPESGSSSNLTYTFAIR